MSRSQKITLCHDWPSDCKKLYILKPYTKLSIQKKNLTAQHLRRKFEGVGVGGGSEQSTINSCMNINVIKIIIFPNISLKSNTNTK